MNTEHTPNNPLVVFTAWCRIQGTIGMVGIYSLRSSAAKEIRDTLAEITDTEPRWETIEPASKLGSFGIYPPTTDGGQVDMVVTADDMLFWIIREPLN